MTISRLAVFAVLAVLLASSAAAPAAAYGTWEPEPETTTRELDLAGLDRAIERLEAAIDLAEQNRSAHPDFLADLWDILAELQGERDALVRQIRESGDPAAERSDGIAIDVLESLAGKAEQIGPAAWETDNTRAQAAYYPRRISLPAAFTADIIFVSGNREVQIGLLDPESEEVMVGGTGAHGSAYFAGRGSLNSPGRTWNERSGRWREILEHDRSYSLRVEIYPVKDEVTIDVFIDGELVKSATGSPTSTSGFPIIRTYGSVVQADNFRVLPH